MPVKVLASPPGADAERAGPSRALVPTLVLVTIVSAAIGSLGAPLLETIARVDHISVGNAQWSLTLPVLVGAVCSPLLGRLGDGPARRTVILAILTGVLCGSVLAAIPGGGFVLLLVGRGMQGLGFALMPLTMAEARDSLPLSRSGPVIAILSIASAAGIGLGYPTTGVLDDTLGLNATFWFGAVVAGIALGVSWAVLPASRQRSHRPLDVSGGAFIGAALLALLLAITEGHSWGWDSVQVISLIAAGVFLAWLWVRRERSASYPLVDLRLLRHRTVVVTNLVGLVLALAMYMFLPLLTDFVQTPASAGYGFGSSVVVAGLMLVPFSVLSASMSSVAAALGRRIGAERVLPIGAVLMAIAIAFFAVTGGALWEAFLATGIMGMGLGFSFAVMPGLIIRSVPPEETASALAFSQVIRFIGFALGSGISASILTAYTKSGQLLPERSGFTVAMVSGAGVCILAAALCLWLGRPASRNAAISPTALAVRAPQVPAAEIGTPGD
jgi:predicted MFS family arabinose efflux permease